MIRPKTAPTRVAAPAANIEVGDASWYGRDHRGKKTASGERFDDRAMTAAHRSLPFGSRIQVENLKNGKSVIVRVNDRGPFAPGRILDLSHAAAQALGMKDDGVAPVRIELLQ